jgi:putative addiction module CopG family antidote
MNVSLPQTWEQFVATQVSAGEFGNASEVVREALRLLRDRQETRARAEMRAAFADVDRHGGLEEPTPQDRALIGQIIRRHRKGKGRV